MSVAVRAMVIAAILIVAATVAPAAALPGQNSADFIEYAAPIAILIAGAWRPKTPAGGVVPPGQDAETPDPASPPAGPDIH